MPDAQLISWICLRAPGQAVSDGWITIGPVTDPTIMDRLGAPSLSAANIAVVACALEKRATLILADNSGMRELAEQEGLSAIGSVDILIHARLEGVIPALKPVLDQLVAAGFHLDPHGGVYKEALKRVGELI